MFDLRALDHSSIIYESPSSASVPQSLLRLATNKQDPNYLACMHADSAVVQVLDARMPGSPISELKGHAATVNSLTWSPTSSGHVCTGGDDCQVLVWDLRPSGSNATLSASASSRAKSAPVGLGTKRDPAYAYTAHYEVNQVAWSSPMPEWIAVSFGKSIQALRLN
jgi:WD repeat-containing protein 68